MPRTLPVPRAQTVSSLASVVASLGLVGALLTLPSSPALGLAIDFEDFVHGEIVSGGDGWTLTAENPNRPIDLGVAFDTAEVGTADPDLEFGSGWASGNLVDQDLGNVLILQESGPCSGGFCANPDDEGTRPAGSLLFVFEGTFQAASFDLIDIESNELAGGSVTFYTVVGGVLGSEVATFGFADFPTLDPSVVYGDRSANRITLDEIGAFGAVRFDLGGSGAIDNLVLVAEPGTLAMLAMGLGGLAWTTRRARRSGI